MVKRATYHHGDLRAALIQAADTIIAEDGIEGFSLRATAQRAGVSPAAPAHHFGGITGLLTEVAVLAFERAAGYLEAVEDTDDPVRNVRALSIAYVRFALKNPGHFRLMLRGDLIDRDDPRYLEVSYKPGLRLSKALAAYHGANQLNMSRFEDVAEIFGGLATMHGLAHLMLEGKMLRLFEEKNPERFLENELPRVLEQIYPQRDVPVRQRG